MYTYDTAHKNDKQRKTDRILSLVPIEGKATKSNMGLTDNGLFNGNNTLHAIMDPENCMWSVKYDKGVIPPQLKQKFTSFSMLKKYVGDYYNRRNVAIKEVID